MSAAAATKPGGAAEIPARDRERSAAVRIRVNRLPVREGDDREEQRDGAGDRKVKREPGRAREQENVEDFVRPVGHR